MAGPTVSGAAGTRSSRSRAGARPAVGCPRRRRGGRRGTEALGLPTGAADWRRPSPRRAPPGPGWPEVVTSSSPSWTTTVLLRIDLDFDGHALMPRLSKGVSMRVPGWTGLDLHQDAALVAQTAVCLPSARRRSACLRGDGQLVAAGDQHDLTIRPRLNLGARRQHLPPRDQPAPLGLALRAPGRGAVGVQHHPVGHVGHAGAVEDEVAGVPPPAVRRRSRS